MTGDRPDVEFRITAKGENSPPTWLGWWLIVIGTAIWPLITFADYSYGVGRITLAGWIGTGIWLALMLPLPALIRVLRRHR